MLDNSLDSAKERPFPFVIHSVRVKIGLVLYFNTLLLFVYMF